jgi:hypothetical protein
MRNGSRKDVKFDFLLGFFAPLRESPSLYAASSTIAQSWNEECRMAMSFVGCGGAS